MSREKGRTMLKHVGLRPWALAGAVAVTVATWGEPLHWCGLDQNFTWLSENAWATSATPADDSELTTFTPGSAVVFGTIDDAMTNVVLSGAVTSGVVRVTEKNHIFSGRR